MQARAAKYFIRFFTSIVLLKLFIAQINALMLVSYGPNEATASVHYNEFLFGIYKNVYKKQQNYPIKGAYSPTHWSIPYHSVGVGECNYIYIPTNNALLPGQQYRISLTVRVVNAYDQMPYFRENFGLALTSDLFKNHFGLWVKDFVPLEIKTSEELVTVDFVFRPLCTSQYVVIGVFQGEGMDNLNCFACQYGFELYNLSVEKHDDPQADFVYICDAFEEQRLEKKYSNAFDTDTVYFNSGSSKVQEKYLDVLDSIPSKLRTKQDLVTLYAYTDKKGKENEKLGIARNASIREALALRRIDTSRILQINYGESKSSNQVFWKDRKVEIDVNRGKLFQKYYTESLKAVTINDYKIANARIEKWLKFAPPDNAIYALFDCWGDGEKTKLFRNDLVRNIKEKHYKGKDLKYTLDSLFCEDQMGRVLPMLLSMNHLPDAPTSCDDKIDSLRELRHLRTVDRIYAENGFPTLAEVGERANKTLPFMIIRAPDTIFQNRYLPIMQKACEEQLVSWEYYALLYDKINVERNGHQRYGTQWMTDKNGKLLGLYPFEDEQMIGEYRKQVGLVPLSEQPFVQD